jgi:hypothetical protein
LPRTKSRAAYIRTDVEQIEQQQHITTVATPYLKGELNYQQQISKATATLKLLSQV